MSVLRKDGPVSRSKLNELYRIVLAQWNNEAGPTVEQISRYLKALKPLLEQDNKLRRLVQELGIKAPGALDRFAILHTHASRQLPQASGEGEAMGRSIFNVDGCIKPETIPLYLVAENIRSAFNVGSLFRIADCVGACGLILCGYTATPEHEKVAKSALGAEEKVPWRKAPDLLGVIDEMIAQGIHPVALETTSSAVDIYAWQPGQGPIALILGNEQYGLSGEVLDRCEQTLMIPTFGYKNSMNVAQAAAVAAYEMRRKLNQSSGESLPGS